MLTYSKGEMIALGIVLPSLASSAVILRLYVHLKKMNSRLSLDDVLITLGLVRAHAHANIYDARIPDIAI